MKTCCGLDSFPVCQLFEAVWGALYKDLGGNFHATYKVYCKLFPVMRCSTQCIAATA